MNFKISELLNSDTANKLGIVNTTSDPIILDNLFYLICDCLQPIRDKLNKPMIITSGFRCLRLNQAIKGSTTSQHSKGQAVDFVVANVSVETLVEKIRNMNITFDQLIEEHDQKGNNWVHISYVHKGFNRKEVLRYKNNQYTKI